MMIRCKNGHYFDDAKSSTCPHCSGADLFSIIRVEKKDSGDEKTIAKALEEESATLAIGDLDDTKTVSFYGGCIQVDPVVGWLVCISGSSFGRDFRLRAGRNNIGRALNNDVVISSDKSVSREKHAVVVYDHKSNKFFIVPENSIDMELNGNVITEAAELNDADRIRIGNSVLMFTPFCRTSFKWNESFD